MKLHRCVLTLFCVQLIGLSGCSPQQSTERVVIGADIISIDGSTGTVKIFCTTATGTKTELSDTGAAQRLGWTVNKVSAARLRLATKDVGSFDIYKDGTDWLVVPTGTFLSPSRKKAVMLTPDGANVRVQIGDTDAPYTDLSVREARTISATQVEQLRVNWINAIRADVSNASGLIVATLESSDAAPQPTNTVTAPDPPAKR